MIPIRDLEKAEAIVAKHSQLYWDGWDILELKRNPSAMLRNDGIYYRGVWYTHRRFSPSTDGWRLPRRYSA
jgi:hypothetical protein